MNRRSLLLSLGALSGLAGCSGGGSSPAPTQTTTEMRTPAPTPVSRLSLGESYRSYGAIRITVDRVERYETVTWDIESTEEPQTGNPPDGQEYAFVHVQSENTGDTEHEAPWYDDFHVRRGDSGGTTDPTLRLPDVDGDATGYFLAQRIVDPDWEWYHVVEKTLPPGESIRGWVPFVVQRSTTLRVGLTHSLGDGEHTIYWQQ